jgi:hypothetical protein
MDSLNLLEELRARLFLMKLQIILPWKLKSCKYVPLWEHTSEVMTAREQLKSIVKMCSDIIQLLKQMKIP